MVQVLHPQEKETFGQLFGRGLGGGISQGFGEALRGKQKEKELQLQSALKMQQQRQKLQDTIELLQGAKGRTEAPGMATEAPPSFGQQINKPPAQEEYSGSPFEPLPALEMEGAPPHTPEEIMNASMINPTVANTWQRQNEDWRRNQEHKQNIANKNAGQLRKEAIAFHNESEKYDEDILKNYKRALNQEIALKDTEGALKSGNVSPANWSSMLRGFGPVGDKISNALLNKDESTVVTNIPYLIEGWKDVFGVRLSDADLRVVQDKLPALDKSLEANLAIVKIMKKYAEMAKLRYKISSDIKSENKKLRPLGFSDEVEKRFQNMSKPVKIRNPNTGNVLEIPAYRIGEYVEDGGEIVDE